MEQFWEFISDRIGEISDKVLETNSEYALSREQSNAIYERLEPILNSETDLTINQGECSDFNTLLDNNVFSEAIMEQELYKQGYLDCVYLLKGLGVLA